MTEEPPVVFIVEDDPSFRTFLMRLVDILGLQTQAFATAEEFLRGARLDTPGCLILDVMMPGLSGLELQRELSLARVPLPVIFITGHGDIPMSVQAMKAGAVSFLTKPLRNQDLLDAIREAINLDRTARERLTEVAGLRRQYDSLTAREREVFAWVVAGLLNKQIAAELGTSERTVKAHRGQIMKKMHAKSLADLVHMADKLGITPPHAPTG
ncbi:MAG TPA: response regulator transcription factor [Candidatus Binatia bacterium]|nr:response regulator transcription factor [Candidatus Binatia bacterium]